MINSCKSKSLRHFLCPLLLGHPARPGLGRTITADRPALPGPSLPCGLQQTARPGPVDYSRLASPAEPSRLQQTADERGLVDLQWTVHAVTI